MLFKSVRQAAHKQISRRNFSIALKNKMEEVVHNRQAEMKEFMKEYGQKKIGEITVGQVVGGMRGMPGMLYETSKLHHIEGIRYRGCDLFQIMEKAPTAKNGEQPLPEAILWLLLTGEFPTNDEIIDFQAEMFRRGKLTQEEKRLISSLPNHMHPMTQLQAGVLICQPRSHFAEAYQMGIQKHRYWEPTLEDCLDLCAKVARIAAIIYHNCYGDNTAIPKSDPWLDYAANFSHLMGFQTEDFYELMRLYIVLHA